MNLSFVVYTASNCLQHLIQANELGRHRSQRDSLNLATIAPKESELN